MVSYSEKQCLERIKVSARRIGRKVTLMEICGGHTNAIMRFGIRGMLPDNVRLISGPGCPVCVSPEIDIDRVVKLACSGVPVATYGDMMRVPGSSMSLDDARAKGGKVFEVYSASDAVSLSQANPGLIFFGVGFETTAPMTAYLLERGIPVYSVHKLVPPALLGLARGKGIDGFLDPGHVSTIIGSRAYPRVGIPQVITGFEPEAILHAIDLLLGLIVQGKDDILNAYPEAVTEEGNRKAKSLLDRHFRVVDSEWRGLGQIPGSGLEVRDSRLDAKIIHAKLISDVPSPRNKGCRCGDILLGSIEPRECPLYRNACNPGNPVGACMVSSEGTCSIAYRYGQ